MATETKSVEWIDERAMAKIVHLKVATLSWECAASGEGCTITYSAPVVLKLHQRRNKRARRVPPGVRREIRRR